MLGVELCAAAKNVIALAAGGVDGLGARRQREGGAGHARPGRDGATRRGARRAARDVRGARRNGRPDRHLLVEVGRNRRAGELIARGATAGRGAREIGEAVEGLTTAPVLRDLSHRLGIELPITESVCAVLEGTSLGDLVTSLMVRTPTSE